MIRPVNNTDWESIAALLTRTKPEPVSAFEVRIDHELDVTEHRSEWVVYTDGTERVVGVGFRCIYMFLPKGDCWVGIQVDPDSRRQGVGQRLLESAVTWARDQGCHALYGLCIGDESLTWAKKRGFRIDRERTEAVLDLNQWDGARFVDAIERVAAQGYRISIVSDVTEPEHVARAYYNVCARTLNDVPAARNDTVMPYESFIREIKVSPKERIYVLAYHKDEIVGIASCSLPHTLGQSSWNEYTAVLPEHRGKGVALAVKVVALNELARRGMTRVRTNNDPDNPPMLQVNARLGYRLVPGPIRVVKQI